MSRILLAVFVREEELLNRQLRAELKMPEGVEGSHFPCLECPDTKTSREVAATVDLIYQNGSSLYYPEANSDTIHREDEIGVCLDHWMDASLEVNSETTHLEEEIGVYLDHLIDEMNSEITHLEEVGEQFWLDDFTDNASLSEDSSLNMFSK
jgi:hypothetical protein